MSVSFGCKCVIKDKNNWRVIHRNHNHSYFEYPKEQIKWNKEAIEYSKKEIKRYLLKLNNR